MVTYSSDVRVIFLVRAVESTMDQILSMPNLLPIHAARFLDFLLARLGYRMATPSSSF